MCRKGVKARAKRGIQPNHHSPHPRRPRFVENGAIPVNRCERLTSTDQSPRGNSLTDTQLHVFPASSKPDGRPSRRPRSQHGVGRPMSGAPAEGDSTVAEPSVRVGSETCTEDLLVMQAFAAGRPSEALNCWLFPRRPCCGASTHIRAMYLAVARRIDRV